MEEERVPPKTGSFFHEVLVRFGVHIALVLILVLTVVLQSIYWK